MTVPPDCPFCQRIALPDLLAESELAVAFKDAFPVSPGHALVVPRRHVADLFELTPDEQSALWQLLPEVKTRLDARHAPAGYNVGVNVGEAAGQTVGHAHVHLIPRYLGDVVDPRGGVRWVVPERAAYWAPARSSSWGSSLPGLAEQVLAVLEDGKFSATYKYAVFLALTDLCIELGHEGPEPPTFTSRQIARKVIELYWTHSREFPGKGVLRQATGGSHRIVQLIEQYTRRHGVDELTLPSRLQPESHFEALLDQVEVKLIVDPIPRLQVLQGHPYAFLYHCHWKPGLSDAEARKLVATRSGEMNTVSVLPGVVDGLVKLNGVLRPLIQREWARRVARMNGFEEKDVLEHLFDSQRVDTSPLRKELRDIQGGTCFFCASPLDGEVHVDHFIPRARYADDSLDNLVLSDAKCNSAKKAMMASLAHVERWIRRFGHPTLEALAARGTWPRDAARTRSVSQALYRGLPNGALLWQAREETISIDSQREAIMDRLLRLNV